MIPSDRLGPPPAGFDPLLGDPRLLAEICEKQVKGLGFEGRNRVIRQQFGDDGLVALADSLSPSSRKLLLEPPLASSWAPFEAMMEIEVAMIRELYAGDPSRHAEISANLARDDLPSLYKFVIRLGGPKKVLKRLAIAFASRVRPGSMDSELLGPREGRATIHDCALPFYFCEHGLPAWATVALTLAGERDPKVEQVQCRHFGAETCEYRVSW